MRRRLKSPASRLFTQPFIQAQIKQNIKSSVSLPFVRGIHRCPVNYPHKGQVTRKIFPLDDVIMNTELFLIAQLTKYFIEIHNSVVQVSMRESYKRI